MSLEHNQADCTGRWLQQLIRDRIYWRCERCRVIAADSGTTTEAALLENALGATLRALADTGQWLIAFDEEDERG